MSSNWIQDVKDFHYKYNQLIKVIPEIPDNNVKYLRMKLIAEEYNEVMESLISDDMIEIADGIIDCIVVLIGTAISYGIDLKPIWDEIHKTNMKKVNKESGSSKVQKPVGWQKPNVYRCLTEQGMKRK